MATPNPSDLEDSPGVVLPTPLPEPQLLVYASKEVADKVSNNIKHKKRSSDEDHSSATVANPPVPPAAHVTDSVSEPGRTRPTQRAAASKAASLIEVLNAVGSRGEEKKRKKAASSKVSSKTHHTRASKETTTAYEATSYGDANSEQDEREGVGEVHSLMDFKYLHLDVDNFLKGLGTGLLPNGLKDTPQEILNERLQEINNWRRALKTGLADLLASGLPKCKLGSKAYDGIERRTEKLYRDLLKWELDINTALERARLLEEFPTSASRRVDETPGFETRQAYATPGDGGLSFTERRTHRSSLSKVLLHQHVNAEAA